jgi:hypothetical protein
MDSCELFFRNNVPMHELDAILEAAYTEIHDRECSGAGNSDPEIRSWHRRLRNTIYTLRKDINNGSEPVQSVRHPTSSGAASPLPAVRHRRPGPRMLDDGASPAA